MKTRRINDKGFRGAREAVTARDGGRCRYCGINTKYDRGFNSPNARTMDHVIPTCQGGRGTVANLVVACFRCNYHKGGRSLAEAGMTMGPKPPFTKEQVHEWHMVARSGNCTHCGLSGRMHLPPDVNLPHGFRRRRCRQGDTLFMPRHIAHLVNLLQGR